MSVRSATVGIGLATLLVGTSLLAGETATPLYTNADLVQLEARDRRTEPAVENEQADWDFVADFLEREHARIDAERDRDLARAEIDAYTAEPRGAGFGCGLLCGGLRHPYFGRVDRAPRAAAGNPSRIGAIRPLHAGPSRAMRMRARAAGSSGRDVFPRRGR